MILSARIQLWMQNNPLVLHQDTTLFAQFFPFPGDELGVQVAQGVGVDTVHRDVHPVFVTVAAVSSGKQSSCSITTSTDFVNFVLRAGGSRLDLYGISNASCRSALCPSAIRG